MCIQLLPTIHALSFHFQDRPARIRKRNVSTELGYRVRAHALRANSTEYEWPDERHGGRRVAKQGERDLNQPIVNASEGCLPFATPTHPACDLQAIETILEHYTDIFVDENEDA